eukprot:69323-Hanusia_phi.AAC.1
MASSPTNVVLSCRQSTQEVDLALARTRTHKAKKSLGSHGRKVPDYTPSSPEQLSPRSSHRPR